MPKIANSMTGWVWCCTNLFLRELGNVIVETVLNPNRWIGRHPMVDTAIRLSWQIHSHQQCQMKTYSLLSHSVVQISASSKSGHDNYIICQPFTITSEPIKIIIILYNNLRNARVALVGRSKFWLPFVIHFHLCERLSLFLFSTVAFAFSHK